jgi:hypothetical protein
MPSLLWRVLYGVGYVEGQEPVYSWSVRQYQENNMALVRVVVLALEGATDWTGWEYEVEGHTPKDVAERATMGIVRCIMERFPQQLAAVMANTFPRGDPLNQIWEQPAGSALVRGPQEGLASDNTAMSAIFATMKAYDSME